jgi:hypothetical protein
MKFRTVNTAILGTIGYYGYINWDKPSWDRRTVSAISVGLVTLWGGEGQVFHFCLSYGYIKLTRFADSYLAQHYSDSRH